MAQLAIVETEPEVETEQEVDPTLAAIAIRLADEGIPVRAIARGVRVPSEDVYELLDYALQEGKILELPKDDWPAGSNRAQRAIYTGTVMENEEILKSLCVRMFKTTRQQSAVLTVLLKRTEVTKTQIHTVLQENRPLNSDKDTDPKMVDVVICNIRKKLRPFNIEIETVWGTGYLISTRYRELAMRALETFSATLTPDVTMQLQEVA